MPGMQASRKETFVWEDGEYTPGSWTDLRLSTSLGKAGNIYRVVLSQSALDSAGASSVAGAMDTAIVNGYYKVDHNPNTEPIPQRDHAFLDSGTTLVPSDTTGVEITPSATTLGAIYSASQSRSARGSKGTPGLQGEEVGVSIKPAAGVTGTLYVTVYSQVAS